MSVSESNNWCVTKIKSKLLKTTNKGLIVIWNSIRSINQFCIGANYSNCQICFNKEYCLKTLVYEELVTDELISRGLLDYAINTSQRKDFNKLPYSILGVVELTRRGVIN